MSTVTIAGLKQKVSDIEGALHSTVELLKTLEKSTTVVAICPPICAPIPIIDPPRLLGNCELPLKAVTRPVTIQDFFDTLLMIEKWMADIRVIIEGLDQNMTLPPRSDQPNP